MTDPVARRCNAWSVACTVVDYEIIDAATPDFYSLIKSARLDEISLTDQPANTRAIVTSRRDVAAASEFYGAMQEYFAKLTEIITLIQKKGTQNGPAIG